MRDKYFGMMTGLLVGLSWWIGLSITFLPPTVWVFASLSIVVFAATITVSHSRASSDRETQ